MATPKPIVPMILDDKSVFEFEKLDNESPRVFVNSNAVVFVDPQEVVESAVFQKLVHDMGEQMRKKFVSTEHEVAVAIENNSSSVKSD